MAADAKSVQFNVRITERQGEYLDVLARRQGTNVTEVLRCAIDAHELVSRLSLLSDPLQQAWLREQTDGLLGVRDETALGLGRVWVQELAQLWSRAFPDFELARFLDFVSMCSASHGSNSDQA
jgi:hypothetical protein